MDAEDRDDLIRALQRLQMTEVGPVQYFAGYLNGHELTITVRDTGRSPRWIVRAYDEDGTELGSDVEDDLSIAVSGVWNKGWARRPPFAS